MTRVMFVVADERWRWTIGIDLAYMYINEKMYTRSYMCFEPPNALGYI